MARYQFHLGMLCFIAGVVFATQVTSVSTAQAQNRSPNFLDNLFNREEPSPPGAVPNGQAAPANDDDITVRLDRMENTLRQLTGTIEQLQYRNQQLEMQLKRMQEDAQYRFQQSGAKGAATSANVPRSTNAPPSETIAGHRGDAFDPAAHPHAPGAPRVLGDRDTALPPQNAENAVPIGSPDNPDNNMRDAPPIDLSAPEGGAGTPPQNLNSDSMSSAVPQIPQLPPRNPDVEARPQLATLPPSARPQDEYDLAYGYVLHKDYALAEQAFRDFLLRYPDERLVPDAQYWLGEALFQQQHYREAAESFLAVSTKYDHASKAPNSLLRLGQSLAALKKKDAACATFAEIGRKYPHAGANVKRGAAQELQRAHC